MVASENEAFKFVITFRAFIFIDRHINFPPTYISFLMYARKVDLSPMGCNQSLVSGSGPFATSPADFFDDRSGQQGEHDFVMAYK